MMKRRFALCFVAGLVWACGDSSAIRCGPGTHLLGALCVADSADAGRAADGGGALDGGAAADAGADGGFFPGDAGTSGAPDGGAFVDAVDPGPPSFPTTIGTLSIAVRTGHGLFDGTDDNVLSLCLTDTRCFPLNVADVNDFRVGEIDVYHFEGVDLPRASVDRVELRSSSGTDLWRPVCLALQFDGEPVYCEDRIGVGIASDATARWRDPASLHLTCVTCYESTLTHGPMLGAVDADRARVLVRTDATRRVGLRMFDANDLSRSRVAAWAYPSPARDYTAVLEVAGLTPASRYTYFFEVDGVPASSVLTLTTAPPKGAPRTTRVAFGSCSRVDAQPIFARIRDAAPDLFFFIGDNHYGNTDDLGSLRWNYRWALERPERAALLAETPTLATWDDHDFVGNNTTGSAPGKERALRAFREYWANTAYGTVDTPGVFSRYSHGALDFFLLDDRYYRGLDGTMLGVAQTAWLRDELAASTATFKVLLSGSQWTAHGSGDSWAAFPAARTALFDFFRDQGIGGVVLLSGDIHHSSFRLITRAAQGGYDLPEITSSPLANTNFSCRGDAEERACFADGNYFVTLDFDTTLADPTLLATIWDEAGNALSRWTILRSSLGPR
jgi:alkaline phosphatase D